MEQTCKQVTQNTCKHADISYKITNAIWNILMVIAFSSLAWFFVTFAANDFNYDRANIFGFRVITVLSGSMEPTLDTHSMAVSNMLTDDYEIGDIVVYQKDVTHTEYEKIYGPVTISIVHRIIDITEDGYYIMKGDNNEVQDPWMVEKNQIIGKIVYKMNWTKPVVDLILGGN